MPALNGASIRDLFLRVEKPARYAGGEFGSVSGAGEGALSIALSYPDLYEIGMSNNAVKILYGRLNRLPGVRCERVFAPAPDMEAELRRRGLPLFTLEGRRPLSEFDVLAFSVGYELNATGVLQILDLGGVPLASAERGAGHPIVLGGGPGIINHAPFLRFFDFIYLGEAEGWLAAAFGRLAALKRRGAEREDLTGFLEGESALVGQRKRSATRAVWTGFGRDETPDAFPVPSLKAAQDHGMVEIMRGCPNGCRFCNAGFLYRPFRVKPVASIARQAYRLTFDFGYRELSLSSLSTGDYPMIADLVRRLNRDFAPIGTSFSLPSLRIDSLALGIFQEIKTVRKSGLTFAIESPRLETQRSINKLVPLDKTIALLKDARSLGWRQAKFYFMLGLPGFTQEDETEEIVQCLLSIRRDVSLPLHINLSTFVPKPHTPFQWCAQLSEEKARERIGFLRSRLPREHFKVSFQAPFQSFLEGLISRGDERVGGLIETGYRRGARFDAWEEHIQPELWRGVLAEAGWDAVAEVCRERSFTEELPWQKADMGVALAALKREAERAGRGELTAPCAPDCAAPCGVCGRGVKAGAVIGREEEDPPVSVGPRIEESRRIIEKNERHRVLFAFAKTDEAVYLSHLNVMTVFERSLLRAGYYCRMSEGFNPKPNMEFASPLPLGFESRFEVASVELYNFDTASGFIGALNKALPAGLRVVKAKPLPVWHPGEKKRSLMSIYAGGDYLIKLKQKITMTDIADLADCRALRFSREKNVQGELIVRYAGKSGDGISFREFMSRILETDDFIRYCIPIRIMTLAFSKTGEFCNYFKTL